MDLSRMTWWVAGWYRNAAVGGKKTCGLEIRMGSYRKGLRWFFSPVLSFQGWPSRWVRPFEERMVRFFETARSARPTRLKRLPKGPAQVAHRPGPAGVLGFPDVDEPRRRLAESNATRHIQTRCPNRPKP